jgi:protein SCO1/2
MIKNIQIIFVFLIALAAFSCSDSQRKLPYLGNKQVGENGDTVFHTIRDFKFVNQDNDTITNEAYKDKIYISDFFFTSCPTICPVMKTQMLRVYEKFKDNPQVGILSHTIDPRHDSVQVLKAYRDRLGIKGNMWQFVTGEQDDIYEIAQKFYMVSAMEDSAAKEEGGFVHSGAFILTDKQRHVRGMYDGTKEEEVTKLIKDIQLLLSEQP